MSVCIPILVLQAQVAPIYWWYKHRSINICLQHHAYLVKRCLFNQLEKAEVEIELFQDGSRIKIKKNVDHHNAN
jgi:hypothetical protein